MKRKVFNSLALGQRYAKRGNYISIKPSGVIVFSDDMTPILKDKKINIVQDEDRPIDWYVEVTKEVTGISVKFADKINRCTIQSSAICRAILESLELEGPHVIMISSESSDGGMYALLTKTAEPTGGGKSKKVKS